MVGHGVIANRYPYGAFLLALCYGLALFPPLSRFILIVCVAIGPVLNPPLISLGAMRGGGVEGGRVYLIQALLLLVVIGAFCVAIRTELRATAVAIVMLVILLVALQSAGRPNAGLAWIYRPIQVFLIAFAVRSLYHNHKDRFLLAALAWGSAIGCALASVHALVPQLDPFTVSRPDNLPFVSKLGDFTRATGAFTYPNNLGTFAAYTIILGSAALLLGRPRLSRALSWFLVSSGSAALLLSGSRAALLGVFGASFYFAIRTSPRRRGVFLAFGAIAAFGIVLAVVSSPAATDVARQRIDTATGESLTLRAEGWQTTLDAFASSPLIGTGATTARTDGFWLLYLSQAGLVGAVLFFLLTRLSFGALKADTQYPELWVALLLVLGTSGLLQDSLGQTLTTWFPGALLGLCIQSDRCPRAAHSTVELEPSGRSS